MQDLSQVSSARQQRALWLSTFAFTTCFAVWMIFSIIGIQIKQDLGLNDTQFGLLIATPVLTGSLIRLFLGVWADQFGGRRVLLLVMLAAAAATWGLTWAKTYPQFLAGALLVGIAGGSFSVGVAYVSKWFPAGRQGTALGIFGAGNIGSAVTKLLAPMVMVAYGWMTVAKVWAVGLAVVGILFYLLTEDDPSLAERRRTGVKPIPFRQQMAPLKNQQVWRFALYYFFVFGAFVALALWLPRYLIGAYGVDVATAGMIAAAYSIPASLFRVVGGWMSDKLGARRVMYWTFGVSVICTFLLSYPNTTYTIHGIEGDMTFNLAIGLVPFTVLVFVLGFFMSLGKAAVYKHIPVYYPQHVGSVGGVVGMIGGLGGFILPIVFGALLDLTGVYTSCFVLLLVVVVVSMAWMHFSIRAMERQAQGKALDQLPAFAELAEIHVPGKTEMPKTIQDWRPEDAQFWADKGRRIARRNLWLSIPALTLAFAVWMVWSVVIARLPAIGFSFSQDQLFWLAALPALSGATLRIFYSFMVPIFGGRLWTTISTASLLIPAMGIGYAVQNPETPYLIFVVLALLCGLGGGNFSSSMANIGFFFPRSEKGNAMALNAGLGNLGVSIMQFLVPVVITMGVFGALGGQPQQLSDGGQVWMQNAGFVWVPFILASTIAAWLGMNDIADAKSSFREQAVIFSRRHNWIMCLLYVGTFGSFIGYSAAFPMLTKLAFPGVNALQYAFLGPLIGALSRAGSGWMADRVGGGRVTFGVFLGMIASVVVIIQGLNGGSFALFFAGFMALFFFSGVGNSSTFQMIPVIMRKEIARLYPNATAEERRRQAERESAAIVAFTAAIGGYGGFFIPKAFGSSIQLTGGAGAALWGFLVFYVLCIAVTWSVYTRRGGLLHDIEHGRAAIAAPAE